MPEGPGLGKVAPGRVGVEEVFPVVEPVDSREALAFQAGAAFQGVAAFRVVAALQMVVEG